VRKQIGFQPYRRKVWIYDRDDEADMLASVGRWAIGSEMAAEHSVAINDLEVRGLIKRRGSRFALTLAGFDRLAGIGWGLMHDEALENQSHAQASSR
jgi:hypothetical protein